VKSPILKCHFSLSLRGFDRIASEKSAAVLDLLLKIFPHFETSG
jgi:hypothetical protein